MIIRATIKQKLITFFMSLICLLVSFKLLFIKGELSFNYEESRTLFGVLFLMFSLSSLYSLISWKKTGLNSKSHQKFYSDKNE